MSEDWQGSFPAEYDSWAKTELTESRQDVLAQRPALVALWAGSPYAKEFHTPRGHQYAVADVTQTLRTADGSGDAACWTCKTPDVPRLMDLHGENGFAAHTFAQLGEGMGNAVGCADCHAPGSGELALSRPHAVNAMNKVKQPFEQQSVAMQGAQTCGQCHVTYYFQPEEDNKVNIPWIFGSTADDIEKYLDTRRFYDWVHPVSGVAVIKARHPEYEHWSRSQHAKLEVTCVTCHMPERQDDNGRVYQDHQIGSAMANFDVACAGCHSSQSQLELRLAESKAAIDAARTEVEALLVQAHFEAGAAWGAGAQWEQMQPALTDIRHAQWRWDFATSSHGTYAHNPEEGLALLATARRQANMARARLEMVLEMYGVDEVTYPDLSSKQSAQQALGIHLPELEDEKRRFIEQQVKDHWPAATQRGY
ncbi:ammonia-forming cytochrome c nitrite reductase subunit c552 [Ferrimonas pelagia]|uniref:nitrite reductase (cytochrome; ammonia-forming) n=1 Tax=Ferrimonas pelagia TaxID=1177826 RepID=A0ABP9EFN1_9GAMM